MPQSYTVRHGSWSPDLSNNGLQVSPNQAVIDAPSVNCDGVYYQDGAFRCLPRPNPYAYSVGVLLSATFTAQSDGLGDTGVATSGFGLWQDGGRDFRDAAGNIIVSVFYESGPQNLLLQIEAPNLGASYFSTITLGTGQSPAVSYLAANATYSFVNGINTWRWTTGVTPLVAGALYAVLLNVFATAPVLNALTFYDDVADQEMLFAGTATGINSLIDGVWSQQTVATEQTVSAPSFRMRARMGGFNQAPTFTAKAYMGTTQARGQLFNGVLVPAVLNFNDSQTGYIEGQGGSLTPNADVNGNTIAELDSFGVGNTWYLALAFDQASLGAAYFSTLVVYVQRLRIVIPFTFNASDATFQPANPGDRWVWQFQSDPLGLGSGNSYNVTLNY